MSSLNLKWYGRALRVAVVMVLALCLGLLIVVQTATPAQAATITTAGSGTWNSTTNNAPWPGGVVPSATDNVVIAAGTTVTIPAGYTATCGDIAVNGSLTLNGPSGNPSWLHVYGGGTSPVTTGKISGGGTITGPGSGGTNIEFTGDWSFSGTMSGRVSFYFEGGQDQDTAGGNVAFPRNLFIQKGGGTVYFPVTPTWTNYFHITNAGSGTTDAGTVCYNGGAQSIAVPESTTYHYYNLRLAGSGSKTISTSGIVVDGTLSIEGTATASAAPTYGAAATLQYNRTASQAAGPEWISTFTASGGVIIANTGIVTLNNAKVVNAPLTINSGATLSTSGSNYALTFGGNFVNNGGTFTAGSSAITISGTGTQSIAGFTTTGTVSMTKTGGTATFQGNVSGGALTINGSGGTLNLGTGLTHTFTGTWTRTAGTLDGGSSTLNLGGGLSGTGGTFTAGTSTVNYNAAGAQTVAGVTYYNLMTSGSGTKTLGGAVIVNGNLTIGSSTTLDVSSNNYGLTVKGNWSNSGTFTQRSGTVTLSGSNAQTMTGATTFYNLILNNNNGLTINSDETVSNMLTLTNGKISTGSNKVIISSTSGAVTRTNGYVIGNLQKNVATGSSVSRTFEVGTAIGYNPVSVTFSSVSVAGNLIGNVTAGEHPNIGSCTIDSSKDVNIYWSFTNSGITFTNYSATFNFNPGDIDGSANTTNFIVGKYSGGWTYPTVGTKTSTSTQATGMTSFSDFAVGEGANNPPTAYSQSGLLVGSCGTLTVTLNGTDPDSDPLTYKISTLPLHGDLYDGTGTGGTHITSVPYTVTDGTHKVTYQPNASYSGVDSFGFKVNDGTVDSAEATIYITVSDNRTTYYQDNDSDTYGNATVSTQACSAPVGYVLDSTDCNDSNANEHPGQTWYKDADNDGYSDGTTNTTSCTRPAGYKVASELTATSGDCNDSNASVHPGATEVCNGIDDNCDGNIDEGLTLNTYYQDLDGDGYGNATVSEQACSAPVGYVSDNTDCNDSNAAIHPGATEICNGIDDNCDGNIDEGLTLNTYYQDLDGDGYGNATVSEQACSAPAGYVSDNTDCDDSNAAINPDTWWYEDNDGDGYGNATVSEQACLQPAGYVLDDTDCNDNDAEVYPGHGCEAAPVTPVGGTAYPINKLLILLPWMALGAAITAGIVILARRRRKAQS